MDAEFDLVPYITERDSTPKPRRKETPIQLERRIAEAEENLHGTARHLATEAQIDDIVKRISDLVVAAVLEAVAKDTKKLVREHISEVFKELAFVSPRG